MHSRLLFVLCQLFFLLKKHFYLSFFLYLYNIIIFNKYIIIMNDKEFLVKAIDNYACYTKARRKLLKIFVNIALEDISIISVTDLQKITKFSKTSIYRAIRTFKADEMIESVLPRSNIYKINSSKLDVIVRHYLTKQNLLEKKDTFSCKKRTL